MNPQSILGIPNIWHFMSINFEIRNFWFIRWSLTWLLTWVGLRFMLVSSDVKTILVLFSIGLKGGFISLLKIEAPFCALTLNAIKIAKTIKNFMLAIKTRLDCLKLLQRLRKKYFKQKSESAFGFRLAFKVLSLASFSSSKLVSCSGQ